MRPVTYGSSASQLTHDRAAATARLMTGWVRAPPLAMAIMPRMSTLQPVVRPKYLGLR